RPAGQDLAGRRGLRVPDEQHRRHRRCAGLTGLGSHGRGPNLLSGAVDGAVARSGLEALAAEVVACRACPRLVAWREQVAVEKRAAFRDEDYWGRPVPGFGDPAADIVVVGLAPAAHGAN